MVLHFGVTLCLPFRTIVFAPLPPEWGLRIPDPVSFSPPFRVDGGRLKEVRIGGDGDEQKHIRVGSRN